MLARASTLLWTAGGLVLGGVLGAAVFELQTVDFEGYEQNRWFQVGLAAFAGLMLGAQAPSWDRPDLRPGGARRLLFIALVTGALTLTAGASIGFAALIAEYRATGSIPWAAALRLGGEAGLRVALWVCLTAAPATVLALAGLRAARQELGRLLAEDR